MRLYCNYEEEAASISDEKMVDVDVNIDDEEMLDGDANIDDEEMVDANIDNEKMVNFEVWDGEFLGFLRFVRFRCFGGELNQNGALSSLLDGSKTLPEPKLGFPNLMLGNVWFGSKTGGTRLKEMLKGEVLLSQIFKFLSSLEVEDFKDVKSGTVYVKSLRCIVFGLSLRGVSALKLQSQSFFEDIKLTKTFLFSDKGTTKITGTTIKWKEGKVAEIIKEDLWPNPLKYFNNRWVDEENMDGDEDDEEFRFLERLLVVHGYWCYKRIAQMVRGLRSGISL
ncbi:hypothetical protein Sjap_022060 [Stephania japonica]|uniref:P-type ATPase C-terminal domain-containing protein n=1 Tax=Stephania japonica TaxID=461633 RepID=A0AAP0EVE2_9MAGN